HQARQPRGMGVVALGTGELVVRNVGGVLVHCRSPVVGVETVRTVIQVHGRQQEPPLGAVSVYRPETVTAVSGRIPVSHGRIAGAIATADDGAGGAVAVAEDVSGTHTAAAEDGV